MLVIPQIILNTVYFFSTGTRRGIPHPPVILVVVLVCLKYITKPNTITKTMYNQNVLKMFKNLYTSSVILL